MTAQIPAVGWGNPFGKGPGIEGKEAKANSSQRKELVNGS